jgi:hypothetical protein
MGVSLAKEHSAVDWSTAPTYLMTGLNYAALDVELLSGAYATRSINYLSMPGKWELGGGRFCIDYFCSTTTCRALILGAELQECIR